MARPRRPRDDWRAPFLEAFARTLTVTDACKEVGISRPAAYDERRKNPDFAAAWAQVEEATTEWLEREALRRAAEGWVERGTYDENGNLVGEFVRKFSDTLLIFMLKARRPETYRENVFVQQSGTIQHNHEVSVLDGQQPVEVDAGQRRQAARALLGPGPSQNGHGEH
jgi:YD repeat-containing protein